MRNIIYHISLFALLVALNGCTLINPYILALNNIEKGQFDRASFKLSNIKNDSLNPTLEAYVKTIHFKSFNSPFKQLDSAIKWAHRGDSSWLIARHWEKRFIIRKSGKKDPFDLLILEIDSLGFIEARDKSSEQAFIQYLENFPDTKYEEKAISMRDSIAFQDAKRENTYLSYKKFIEKYPNSKQAEAAREIYELLLFETHTRDKHRISYENFIKKFPHSPYLKEAEEKLFELYTLDYRVLSFKDFIDSFPNSFKVDEARLWIKHKQESYDSINPVFAFPQKNKESYLLIDPINTIYNLELDSIKNHFACEPYREQYLIYEKSGKWGLANAKGQGQIPALFHNLEKLRNDTYVYSNESKKGLAHVSGFRITNAEFDNFHVLTDTFISVEKNQKYALAANNGKLLTEFEYDGIQHLGMDLLAFKRKDSWAILKGHNFLKWPDIPKLEFQFDTVFNSQFNRIYAKTDSGFILLNEIGPGVSDLAFDIITETDNYLQTFSNGLFLLYDDKGQLVHSNESKIYIDNAGYAWKKDSLWHCKFYLDSLKVDSFTNFNNYYKKLFLADSLIIYNRKTSFPISKYKTINTQIYKYNESDTFCFVVGNGKYYGLISALGDTILKLEWEDVKVFDKHSIRVSKKGKYGLYDFKGKEILKPEFTAISNYDNGALTLFKNNKFGLIHSEKSFLVPCKHSSSLKLLNLKSLFYTIKKDENLILFDRNSKEIAIAKEYFMVNDSLIFFNQEFSWKLQKLNNKGEFERTRISALRYSIWQDGLNNKHVIYETSTGTGFYNICNDETIYPEYFHIYPITDREGMLYVFYTFKYFEEIDLYLLKVLDLDGLELKKALITKEQASKLSCINLLDE